MVLALSRLEVDLYLFAAVWRRLLRQLARDPQAQVLAAVAGSPLADLDLWVPLACDPRKEVRAAVALNPLTPIQLLADFVYDRSVRRALGRRVHPSP